MCVIYKHNINKIRGKQISNYSTFQKTVLDFFPVSLCLYTFWHNYGQNKHLIWYTEFFHLIEIFLCSFIQFITIILHGYVMYSLLFPPVIPHFIICFGFLVNFTQLSRLGPTVSSLLLIFMILVLCTNIDYKTF